MTTGSLERALRAGDVERLLIRAPNWLGDVAFAWPVFEAARRGLPGLRVEVAARPRVAGLFEAVEGYAVLRWPERPTPGALRRAVAELRARCPAALVLLPHSFEAALAPWLARVPHRLGYATHGRSFMLTEHLPRVPGRHQRDEYLALLDPMGLAAVEADAVIRLREPLLETARQLGRSQSLVEDYAVLAPGAAYGGAKQWGVSRFSELAARLAAEGLGVCVVGAPGESELGAALVESARLAGAADGALVNLVGRTTLAELAGLTANARLVVANDSGPLHLAAGLGTPAVGIYGATDPARTGPRGSAVAVVRHEVPCAPCGLRECNQQAHHCMIQVTPEEVLARGLELAGPRRQG